MLSDDIVKGVSTGVSTGLGVIGSALRGAVMFGALALAVVSIAVALPAVLGAASVLGGIGLFLGALPAAAASAGIAAAGIGAIGGAALLGITRLVPGSKERAADASYQRAASYAPPLRAQESAAHAAAGDNPHFQAGLGARLAERGSSMQGAGVGK